MATGLSNDLAVLFEQFARFGDSKCDGKTITLKNADKWMKQAKVFTATFSTIDTGIEFSKFRTKKMDLRTFHDYIDRLCEVKRLNKEQFITKLMTCGAPGTSGATKVAKMSVTDRLTDASAYTGAHKERFDESGQGRGIDGRRNVPANDGYVQGYKEKDTYDGTH